MRPGRQDAAKAAGAVQFLTYLLFHVLFVVVGGSTVHVRHGSLANATGDIIDGFLFNLSFVMLLILDIALSLLVFFLSANFFLLNGIKAAKTNYTLNPLTSD